MAPTTLPDIPSKIPNITRLRENINYSEDRKPQGLEFWKHLQAFRQKYIADSGLRGRELTKWKDQQHQAALTEMVDNYLDDRNNGEKFWPDDAMSPRYNGLQYSMHHESIKSKLIQLIYRMNVQKDGTSQHKDKDKKSSRRNNNSHSIGSRSDSTKHAAPATTSSFPPTQHGAKRITLTNKSKEPSEAATSARSVLSGTAGPSLTGVGNGTTGADLYRVPERLPSGPSGEDLSGRLNRNQSGSATASLHGHKVAPSSTRQHEDKHTSVSPQNTRGTKRPTNEDSQIHENPSKRRKQAKDNPSVASSGVVEMPCVSPLSDWEDLDPPAGDKNAHVTSPYQHNVSSKNKTSVTGGTLTRELLRSSTQLNGELSKDAPQPHAREQTAVQSANGRFQSNQFIDPDDFLCISRTASPSARRVPDDLDDPFEEDIRYTDRSVDASLAMASPGFRMAQPTPNRVLAPEANMDLRASYDLAEVPGIVNQTAPENLGPEEAVQRTESTEPTANESEPNAERVESSSQNLGLITPDTRPRGQEMRDASLDHDFNSVVADRPNRRHHTVALGTTSTTTTPQKRRPDESQIRGNEPITPVTPSSSKGKARSPNVHVSFVLVLSRYPRWRGEKWVPKSKLSQRTLTQLIEELPSGFASSAPGLMFRFRGPGGFRTEEPVPHGEDDTFRFMQQNFTDHIRKAKRSCSGDFLSFRIEIEALEDDYLLKAGEHEEVVDDEEFF